ncbi:MAG TPA: proton-conducting transporter membrane subunit [Anaeromyxobacteraceae bacterium]|nr:proton-conducting transporter membrane subunit [Anaeromyxobacteraceae bacterium]
MTHETHELARVAVTHVGYLWLIPLFPAVGALWNALFGWKLQKVLGKKAVHTVAVTAMFAAFAVALRAFIQMKALPAEERFLQDTLWNLLTAGRLRVDFAFALDQLSMMMVLIITFIGSLIHVFSIGYMADEPSYWRFFSYLNLFVFAMLLLVMGDNFAVMFFGWEGVGLASYLLISFWYTDREKAAAGMKAFVVNRFGDFGFLAGLFLLFWGLGGAWDSARSSVLPTYVADASRAPLAYAANAAQHAQAVPLIPVAPAPAHEAAAEGHGEAAPEHGALAEGAEGHGEAAEGHAAEAAAPAHEGHAVAAAEAEAVKVAGGPTMNFRELRDELVLNTGVKEGLLGQKFWGVSLLTLVGMLLFIGAMGKSAQLPLYVWLPDAMAGPTPVSALIHAATMVTAGVYMVARLNFVFSLSPSAMGWVALIGAITALFSASIGFFQYDIKKVLAYSTVSQLGFMFIGVGIGSYWAGVYHLLTHAFFKATLFLGSGSVILGCHHEQDMRKMGGLKKFMPITRWTYLYACIAIAGFPIANGFYSKDEILWKAFTSRHLALFGTPTPWLGPAIYVIGIIAATGTAFYMYRSYYMTFTGEYRGGEGHHATHNEDPHSAAATHKSPTSIDAQCSDGAAHVADAGAHGHGGHDAHGHAAPGHDDHSHGAAAHDEEDDAHGAHGGHHGGTPHESPWQMTIVLATLAIGSGLTLFLGIPTAWTGKAPLLEHWLEPVVVATNDVASRFSLMGGSEHANHQMELLFQGIGVAVAFIGWLAARALYKDNKHEAALTANIERFKGIWTVVYNKYFVDELYAKTVVAGSMGWARVCSWFDANVVDAIVNLAGTVTRAFSNLDAAIDKYVVDGLVNAVADGTGALGTGLRRFQTGRIQTYLYGALGGALVVVLINFLIK